MHFYQFNIGDYRRRSSHLSLLEHGIYRMLIDTYYLEERMLTLDKKQLMRTHNVRTCEEVAAFENVLLDFFRETKKGYKNKTCDDVIFKYREKSEKARASAKVRWNANASKTQSKGNTNHKPITKEPITNINDRFNEFWNLYDKKAGLKKCKVKWKRLKKMDIELIFKCLPAYVSATPDKQYRKHPLTWLNGESWNDEIVKNSNGDLNWNSLGWS